MLSSSPFGLPFPECLSTQQWRFQFGNYSGKSSKVSGTGVHYTASLEINPSLSLRKSSFSDFPLWGTKHIQLTIWVVVCSPLQLELPCWGKWTSCFTFLFKINGFIALWLTVETLHWCQLAEPGESCPVNTERTWGALISVYEASTDTGEWGEFNSEGWQSKRLLSALSIGASKRPLELI